MRLILLFVPMMALSILISGCGASVPLAVQDDVCPTYPKIKAYDPEIKGQIKAFRKMLFLRDTAIPKRTAVCKFHNNDYDNEMKDAIIISQEDLFKLITEFGYMLSEVEQHNNRVESYGENNATLDR